MPYFQIEMIGINLLKVSSGEAVFRQKFDSGLLKLYTAFDNTDFELTQEDINSLKVSILN